MIALSRKQLERARFINQHIIDNDNFPTHKQLSIEFNIPTSASMTLITSLYSKGWITQQKTAQSYMRTPVMKNMFLNDALTTKQAVDQKKEEAQALKKCNAETVARRRRIAEILDDIKIESDAK